MMQMSISESLLNKGLFIYFFIYTMKIWWFWNFGKIIFWKFENDPSSTVIEGSGKILESFQNVENFRHLS